MEYCPNGSLQDAIKSLSTLPIELVKHYTVSMVKALEFAHEKNIVHRDLKPGNILLDTKLRIKIVSLNTPTGVNSFSIGLLIDFFSCVD